SATRRSAWLSSVRSAHRASTPAGSFVAALRLPSVSRSATTTWRPSSDRRRTVADPTRPKPPVTSTVSDIRSPTCGYGILFFREYHTLILGERRREHAIYEQQRGGQGGDRQVGSGVHPAARDLGGPGHQAVLPRRGARAGVDTEGRRRTGGVEPLRWHVHS